MDELAEQNVGVGDVEEGGGGARGAGFVGVV